MRKFIATTRALALELKKAGLATCLFYLIHRLFLEREDDVVELMTVARGLQICDMSASAVRDTRLGNLAVLDDIVMRDVFRSDDAGDQKFANFEIDANLLATLDDKVSVWQGLGNDGGNRQRNGFASVH